MEGGANLFCWKPVTVPFHRKKTNDDSKANLRGVRAYELAKCAGYTKLEERRVLNATFAFDLLAAELTLENFVDSGVGDNSVELTQIGNDLVFDLNDGIWSANGPTSGLNFSLSNGDSTLTVLDGSTTLDSLRLDANSSDVFDVQIGQFNFGTSSITIAGSSGTFGVISELAPGNSEIAALSFDFSSNSIDLSQSSHQIDIFSGSASGDIELNNAGDIELGLLVSEQGSITVESAGDVTVANDPVNPTGISITDPSNLNNNSDSVTLTASNGSIFVNSSVINSAGGSILLTADSDITIQGELSTEAGTIELSAGGNVTSLDPGTLLADQLIVDIGGDLTLDGANQISNIAGNVNGGLTLFNDQDITINSTSSPVGQDGLTVQGDFQLQVTGSVDQEAALVVLGDSIVNATGIVSLDEPNDFVGSVTASGTSVEIVDINDLLVLDIDATDQIRLRAGLGTDSDITIQGELSTEAGTIELSAGGNVTSLDPGTLLADQLIVDIGGDLTLDGANQISNIAGNVNGGLTLFNDQDITINSTSSPVGQDGLTVQGDFQLQVTGSVDQEAALVVLGDSIVNATGIVSLDEPNDFVGSVTASGTSVEIVDINDLLVLDIDATDQIRLRAGLGTDSGALTLAGNLQTASPDGQILLQADEGIEQLESSIIVTPDLLLGSSIDPDSNGGDFILTGDNLVGQLAADNDGAIEFTNRQDLTISNLLFDSPDISTSEVLAGLSATSVVLNITGIGSAVANLEDSDSAITAIDTTAQLNVDGDIVLGDGNANLEFTNQTISDLIDNNASDNFVSINAAGNAANEDGTDVEFAQNVTLFVNSSIVLSDASVAETLFVDTTDSESDTGDILQTWRTEETASLINASDAAFVAGASVQLTNVDFNRIAIETTQQVNEAIQSFELNSNIGSTFTGSLSPDVFLDPSATEVVLRGNGPIVPDVFNVEDQFVTNGFAANNNGFLTESNAGTIVIATGELELVSFDALQLISAQLQNVQNPGAAVTSLGDIYIETVDTGDLGISGNVEVISAASNITVVAGGDVAITDSAELIRSNGTVVVGVVNTLQGESFQPDAFELGNPRSSAVAAGNAAFSDTNAQLDSVVGFQTFDLFFGNSGEQSFNLIVGFFLDSATPSQGLDADFQSSLINSQNDTTTDFLLADFENFGQSASAFSLRTESLVVDTVEPLELTNISQFEQAFFAQRSFLLSQLTLTNDANINLFADGGSQDLNFSQEVLPARTVVENPGVIVVPLPTFIIPEAVGAAPMANASFGNIVTEAESPPLTTEQIPLSYFQVKYTADDDGVFEEEFKWTDENDDPDAIRAAIEDGGLYDADGFWPETSDQEETNWTEKIKDGKVKPGLYFIFEVQEGQLIPDPVDAPVDRTDLENLIQPSDLDDASNPAGGLDAAESANLEPQPNDEANVVNEFASTNNLSSAENSGEDKMIGRKFSKATEDAMLGGSLLLAQSVLKSKNSDSRDEDSRDTNSVLDNKPANYFSRANRIARKLRRSN